MDTVNKFGVRNSQIKVGIRVNTTDGDNGIIEKIIPGNPFPLFVKFENGSAWQNLNHIKEVL